MAVLKKTGLDLDKKFQKILQTPEGFGFFEAIHDFVEYIELNPTLAGDLSSRSKASRELNIPAKYSYLRQIYQGLEDVATKTNKDIGHERYMNVRDLSRIQNQEFSESNTFWKKRALFKKLAGEVYERLTLDPSAAIAAKAAAKA